MATVAASIQRAPLRLFSSGRLGGLVLLLIAGACVLSLPWSMHGYNEQRLNEAEVLAAPSWAEPMGTDNLGRSLMWRCAMGGMISLSVGFSAAVLSVVIGTLWGCMAGYVGGRVDALMMRVVDVLYGLPYILLVVLLDLALQPVMLSVAEIWMPVDVAMGAADVATLLLAIGSVSWLTLARVVRGQVLSLRGQPFMEAARAYAAPPGRIMWNHLLPNLMGPIVVYTTLTVPTAILQESFLSFLGIGIRLPLPSWGNLAAEGLGELHNLAIGGLAVRWWRLVWPCLLLGLTLLSLNLVGESLRRRLDPRSIRR